MAAKNDADTVFFFTLIDFLLQVCFFGLIMYAVSQALEQKKPKRDELADAKRIAAAEKIEKLYGVSNITELSDELSRLAPMDKLRGSADFIQRVGGTVKANEIVELLNQQGGIDKVRSKLLDGVGKPGCAVGTKGELLPIATLFVGDEQIEVEALTPELRIVLDKSGLNYEEVRTTSVNSFSRVWSKIIKTDSACRHTVIAKEKTKLSAPLRAVGSVFYTKIR
jgi:hypothetical protein